MSIKPHGKEVKLEYIKLCLLKYKIETNAKRYHNRYSL